MKSRIGRYIVLSSAVAVVVFLTWTAGSAQTADDRERSSETRIAALEREVFGKPDSIGTVSSIRSRLDQLELTVGRLERKASGADVNAIGDRAGDRREVTGLSRKLDDVRAGLQALKSDVRELSSRVRSLEQKR